MKARHSAVSAAGLLAALVLSAAGPLEAAYRKHADKADTAALVQAGNAFALDLYGRLRGREGNLFLSPFSISTALAMTWAGARGGTAEEMARVLHLGPGREGVHEAYRTLLEEVRADGDEGCRLHVANALWGDKGFQFRREFLELVETSYGAGLRQVDFRTAVEAARRTINAWVEKETRHKIRDLLKPGVLKPTTRLVLTNAVYFKGDWARRFDEKLTRPAPFWVTAGKKVDLPMMHQTGKFKYAAPDGLQVLELPYAGGDFSMVVLLPRKRDGLGDLEKNLSVENLAKWLKALRRRKVVVALPRFKATSEFGLGGVLKSMGMRDAFDASAADFSGMTGRRDLFIQAVVHKAFVEVNEEGTEAAAATGVVVGLTSVALSPPVFRADHPFLFLIRDRRSGSILFIGRLMNPQG